MTVEQAVIMRLKATAAVAALVSTRVWQLILPQRPTLPAIRVQLIDEPKMYHMRGANGETRARVQTDAYADTLASGDWYQKASDIANAIDGSLTGAPFTIGTVRVSGAFRLSRMALYEAGELRLVRIMQDYIVWSQPV